MQKIINYLIGAFVFLSSIFYLPGQNFHDSQYIFFRMGAMVFFALFLSFKPLRRIRNVWISSYLVCAIINFMVLEGVRSVAVTPLINIFLMVCLYYVFSNYLEDETVIYNAIKGIIAVNLIFLIFQVFKVDPVMLDDVGKRNIYLVGLFGHPMNMGIFCSVVLPYVFFRNKIWAILVFLLLIISKSYISIFLGIAGVLLYLFFTDKKWFKVILIMSIIIAILFCACVLLFYSAAIKNMIVEKFTLRWNVNYPFLRVALSNPHHGYGLGTFIHISKQLVKNELIEKKIGFVDVTWNDYLGSMIEMGVGVLFIFFGFFKQILVRFKKSFKNDEITALFCSLVTIPIGMMFHSYMNYINVGIICIALYSLLEIKWQQQKEAIS